MICVNAFVSFLIRVLYRDLLLPDDQFLTQLRKMFIAIQIPLSLINLWYLFSLFTESRQTPIYVPGAAIRHILMTFTQISTWSYIRATRSAPDWLMAFSCNTLSLLFIAHSLTVTNAPNYPSARLST